MWLEFSNLASSKSWFLSSTLCHRQTFQQHRDILHDPPVEVAELDVEACAAVDVLGVEVVPSGEVEDSTTCWVFTAALSGALGVVLSVDLPFPLLFDLPFPVDFPVVGVVGDTLGSITLLGHVFGAAAHIASS